MQVYPNKKDTLPEALNTNGMYRTRGFSQWVSERIVGECEASGHDCRLYKDYT